MSMEDTLRMVIATNSYEEKQSLFAQKSHEYAEKVRQFNKQSKLKVNYNLDSVTIFLEEETVMIGKMYMCETDSTQLEVRYIPLSYTHPIYRTLRA